MHQGEKLFKCLEEGCLKAFNFKCHLIKHKLTHAKGKPHMKDPSWEKLLEEVKQEIFNEVDLPLQEFVQDEVGEEKFVKEEEIQEFVKEEKVQEGMRKKNSKVQEVVE